jgi:ferrous-iron efflux pump FieF
MSATRTAIIRSTALLGLKSGAFVLTGSAAIGASLVDSVVDVAASIIAHTVKPKDHHVEHQVALIQAAFIVVGGFVVLVESIKGFNEPVELATVGMLVLVATLVIDGSIVRKLLKETNPVVHGLAEDIKADMVNSAGGLIALTAIAVGFPMYVDKVIAVIISLYLIFKGSKLLNDNISEASEDHSAEHDIQHESEGSLEQYV